MKIFPANEPLSKERSRVLTHREPDDEEAKEGTCRLGRDIRAEQDLLSKTAGHHHHHHHPACSTN